METDFSTSDWETTELKEMEFGAPSESSVRCELRELCLVGSTGRVSSATSRGSGRASKALSGAGLLSLHLVRAIHKGD